MKRIFLSTFILFLLFSGCSTTTGPHANYTKTGTVEYREVSVKDGGGAPLGGMIGSVVGSLAGNDNLSNALGVIFGGIAGSYIGEELSRYDSSELTIGFDDGDSVMVSTRDLSIQIGDRVKVIKKANQFPKVEKIAY